MNHELGKIPPKRFGLVFSCTLLSSPLPVSSITGTGHHALFCLVDAGGQTQVFSFVNQALCQLSWFLLLCLFLETHKWTSNRPRWISRLDQRPTWSDQWVCGPCRLKTYTTSMHDSSPLPQWLLHYQVHPITVATTWKRHHRGLLSVKPLIP